ncbi:MAG: FIVAR domain-containing protein [Prevotella sp.]|nr:FIVAR domain-containing protein [Prevotella sp.]
MRKMTCMLIVLMCAIMANAQTDYTSLITNPSFEQGTDGWEHKGMSAQGNNVFSIKDGNTYMERWTGRGGAVGSGKLSQVLYDLPPGNYELSVAAQNIQEDTPQKAQTGAWIFAESPSLFTLPSTLNKTTVTVRDTYKVAFNFVTGSVTIGFEAKDASGNWIAVDNFRLTRVGDDLSAELTEAIQNAETAYGNASGKESQQLKDAISAAQAVATKSNATADEQAAAIVAMEQAIDIYLRANAGSDNPLDMTDHIINPSFETGDLTGWTSSGMGTQSNSIFSIKDGSIYVEKWSGRGSAVGDARLSQKLTNMPAGRYRLTAAAQNIQENTPQEAQSGAWIFAGSHTEAVTVRNTYTLEFVQVADVLEIGFEAKGATGNWISVDNFRLEYISDDMTDVKTELSALIAQGDDLDGKRMNAEAKQALTEALAAARAALNAGSGLASAATALEAAIATATTSHEIFARLADAIATANEEISVGSGSATATEAYQQAINAAQAVYDAAATTDEQAEAAIAALADASFAFKVQTGGESGTAPTVTTDTRFIRGCTWAFGRSTVKGGNILEEGFCWSEQPDPKVTDNRTTEYLNQAGKIYWIRDLKPATVYYMRAYAINKDYAVGYGDVIKVVTVPKGTVGHWYNNGGDEASNDRINYAINLSMDYYWNNLTSIHGFGISVSFGSGTPTADCSYGGSMRVGPSSSYQQPGTIMHEAFHGIGVGTHGMWWNGEMRSAGNRGDWLGDRVTEAVRFWDNSTTAVITGDDMHLWPYGCNGAHEDTHNDNLYCMMGILAQALNEDGLPGSGEIGYALPYYAFNHEDGVKYYIKNEDESRGLRSAYLVETANHTLEWKTMSAVEAAANNAAAWYLSFTPNNQYYQLRNAATGYYMTYASGIKTVNHASATSADNFHLMRGRVDVDGHRGYYIIHPESSANPPCLNATANGKTGTAQWNIAKSAKTQRWLILTAEEALNFDNGNIDLARKELSDLLAQIRKLAQTPHNEDVVGADVTLASTLSDIESEAAACTKGSEITALIQQARTAAVDFLSSVSATDEAKPFDLSFMIENPDFDSDATTGWTSTNGNPGYGAKAAEFYEKTFNYYQALDNMPSGHYELHAYAFQRPGAYDAVLAPYLSGTAKVTSSLYINSTSADVKHICDDRQPNALYTGDGSDKKLSDGTYIPNTMTGASKYFAKGLYDSSVDALFETKGGTLRVGIKCTNAPAWYWTMFDHFRLYFFGGNKPSDGIDVAKSGTRKEESGKVYDLQGRRIDALHKKGLYIIDGKKMVISK